MEHAYVEAKRSTCTRLNVGAVISAGGRVLSTGYNGPPAGLPHCTHERNGTPCKRAIHAEQNAIFWAARKGVATEEAHLYVTHMPCYTCATSIIQAGIIAVTYHTPYRDESGVELLQEAGIRCVPYFERLDS